MKIVITATGDSLESPVDPRFGRADTLLLYDDETGEVEAVDNGANRDLPQGAGIQAAARVAELGASCVLTGRCGPKAFRTLEAAGIDVFVGIEGTVGDALARFESGALRPAAADDASGPF